VEGLKDHPEMVAPLRHRLTSLALIRKPEINPRSSSLVLHYEPTDQVAFSGSLRELFPSLGDLGYRSACRGTGKATDSRQDSHGRASPQARQRAGTDAPDFAGQISRLFRSANAEVEQATGGIDLSLLVPLVLLLLSIIGIAAGAFRKGKLPLPSWYELLWFAFNTFVILNLTLSKRREFESASQSQPHPAADQVQESTNPAAVHE
jgi:hypothetical protein